MSLRYIIKKYIREYRPCAQDELNWFQQQSTLREAVNYAARSIDNRKKRYSHQRRLKKVSLEQAQQILLTDIQSIEQARDFDALFELVDRILKPVNGIGELYVYDTALRIGSKKGIYPTKIYLHAGTRVGAKALGFDGKAETLEKSALLVKYPEFHPLEPHEIEDVLCIFKADLKKASNKNIDYGIFKRSRCS